MAQYYNESPEITENIDWDTIIDRAPSTNIGMVPFQYGERTQLPFLSNTPSPGQRIDFDTNQWVDIPGKVPSTINWNTGYVLPGDPRVRDTLNESVNTELNLDNRSNKFFPYEKDYSGIMAARSLQEGGDPIYDMSRWDPSKLPPSERVDADEYGRPVKRGRYGVKTHWGAAPTDLRIGLNVPKLEQKKGYIDSTLLHEAKHYYQSKYGFDITQLSKKEMHNVIYQFQGMYDNPVDRNRTPSFLNKKEAGAYMAMHKQGKQWYQNQGQGFPKSKAEINQERRALWDRRDAYHNLMMAGQDKLGHTFDQSMKQFDRMYDYETGHRRGDYTAPTMTQQQMGREAQVTGGRVNPHEATRAQYQEQGPAGRSRARPRRRPSFNTGGLVSLVL